MLSRRKYTCLIFCVHFASFGASQSQLPSAGNNPIEKPDYAKSPFNQYRAQTDENTNTRSLFISEGHNYALDIKARRQSRSTNDTDDNDNSEYDTTSYIQRRYWTGSAYPNPQVNHLACGMRQTSHVCDPDNVISEEEMIELDSMLLQLTTETNRPVEGNLTDCEQRGIVGWIIMMKTMKATSAHKQLRPTVLADTAGHLIITLHCRDSNLEARGLYRLCSECKGLRVLPKRFRPQILNVKICNTKEPQCLNGHGSCLQRYEEMKVEETELKGRIQIRTVYRKVLVQRGCECAQNSRQPLMTNEACTAPP